MQHYDNILYASMDSALAQEFLETTLITLGGNRFSHIIYENRLFKTSCVLVLIQVP